MQSGQKLDRDFWECNFPIAFGIYCKAIEKLVFDNADLCLVMIANRIMFRLLPFPSLPF